VTEITGALVGWEPARRSPFKAFLREATSPLVKDGTPHGRPSSHGGVFAPGTYELCGPKINGNPERLAVHTLFRHDGAEPLAVGERTYAALRARCLALWEAGVEGIVFRHPDGRSAKIKGRDF
jgi:hypothetical protein